MGINSGFEKESEYFLASLSYLTLGIIGIFILVSEIDRDEFLRFHAKQSIGYWLITLPLWIIFSFLFKYLYSITLSYYVLNKIFFYLWKFIYIYAGFFIIIYAVYLSFSASQGRKKEVSLISKILKKIGVKL
ncbi:MAG: hypothetical protein N3D74_04790 [Caldisericia bacterium]|nr:hypothetical protein [Caldisericia bacterium]